MEQKKKKKEIKKDKYYMDSSYVILDDKDYLENYIYSDELSNKINRYFESDNKQPLYIGIIGSWGSGKTSIVETVLKKQDKKTIIYRYDAWKYEGDSFRRNFIQSILDQSIKHYNLTAADEICDEVKESLYEDYTISTTSIRQRLKLLKEKGKNSNIVSMFVLIALMAVLIYMGIYKISIYEITAGNIFAILGTIGLFNIFYSTTVYSKSKLFSSEQFYKNFIKILIKVRGHKNIILIDNLDRCDEKNLKETLNTIKGFYVDKDEANLKNEKVIFIIPLDIDSLYDAYSKHTIHYLDKIFDDMIYIKTKYSTDKLDFINKILKEYPEIDLLMSQESKSIIINSAINTPREIIKTINDYVTEYNILLNKTSKEFAENEKNRSFLMKTVIYKRRFHDFYQRAFDDIENFIGMDSNPNLRKDFDSLKDELKKFLISNRAITPTNYYEFFQSQNIKDYNKIPDTIKDAIMNQNIEEIIKYEEKDRIISYYKNIHDDLINGFWNTNILNKYITLIDLYHNKYFSDEEIEIIKKAWNKVFEDIEFKQMNTNNLNIIGYERELIFGTEIYKKPKFNTYMLDCINENIYKFDNEDDKYEKLSQWLKKNNDLSLNEKYEDLLNKYCEYLINNEKYSQEEYLTLLFGKNIKLIKIDNIRKFIMKNDDNEIVLKLLDNLIKEQLNDAQIANDLVTWASTKEITNVQLINIILDYLNNNNVNISSIEFKIINISQTADNEEVLSIMNKYFEKAIYNMTLFKILKQFKEKDNIEAIILNMDSNLVDNSEYITNFINYLFEVLPEIGDESLKELANIARKYPNYRKVITEKTIQKEMLKNYYDCFTVSEDRESILNDAMELLSNNFEQQLNNIFVYESSPERMNILISNHNAIKDYVLIINKTNKTRIKNKLITTFIGMLEDKDNIVAEEYELINSLNVNADTKEKINNILKSKESKNKELVEI